MHSWRLRVVLVAALGGLVAGGGALALRPRGGAAFRLADADDAAAVGLGRRVYAAHCAACHGRRLQGQPLWQAADADSARRAPALDWTGHSWQRGDAELIRIVELGGVAGAPGQRRFMPAFAPVLSDGEVLAAIAFIKARWPLGMRVVQAARNRGAAGMPREAAQSDWTFPAMCRARD